MKNATDITILLDRSGSMSTIKQDVLGGLNEFLREQQAVPGECAFTLVQFDHENPQEVVVNARPISEVKPLTGESFTPRGYTPLYDAMGRCIVSTGERLKALSEEERPSKIVFVIMTDGQENASREFNRQQVFEMVQRQMDVYKWNFVYLGANQDAMAVGASIGTQIGTASTFDPSQAGAVYAFASSNVARYRQTSDPLALNWTPAQRAAMGKKRAQKEKK